MATSLHLLAGGLVWLVPSAERPGVRVRLMQRLCGLSDAFLPDGFAAASSPGNADGKVGLHALTDVSRGCKLLSLMYGQKQEHCLRQIKMQAAVQEGKGMQTAVLDAALGISSTEADDGGDAPGVWVRTSAMQEALLAVASIAAEGLDA